MTHRNMRCRIGNELISGKEWYLGAMTNEAARTLDVPLTLLGTGRYQAELHLDGDAPDRLRRDSRSIAAGSATLQLQLAANGGAVARLSPLP